MEILSTVFMPDARVFGDLAAHRPPPHCNYNILHWDVYSLRSSCIYSVLHTIHYIPGILIRFDLFLSPSLFSISFYYNCFFILLLFATNNGNPVVDFLVFSTVIMRWLIHGVINNLLNKYLWYIVDDFGDGIWFLYNKTAREGTKKNRCWFFYVRSMYAYILKK